MVFKRHDPQSAVIPELKPEQSWTSTANKLADGASIIGSDLVIEGPSITMRCKGSLRIDRNNRSKPSLCGVGDRRAGSNRRLNCRKQGGCIWARQWCDLRR